MIEQTVLKHVRTIRVVRFGDGVWSGYRSAERSGYFVEQTGTRGVRPMNRLLALLFLGSVFASTARADAPPEIAGAVDKLVQPYLDAHVVNAISIGVVQGDKQWSRHYGQLSEKQPKKPDDQTIYELGSISKVFTGILLADAVVQKRVRLNQAVGELVPELKANEEVGEAIQLKHLSTHVSGLPRMPINMRPADIENPYADYDRDMMIAFLTKLKPIRKPGVKGEYSNLAVGLLGQILAIEADQSYMQLLKQNLTGPLEMSQTSVKLGADQQSHLAPPHDSDRQVTKNWDLNSFVGAGGIRSNTTDMLKFISAQLKPNKERIGKAIDLAWREQLPSQDEAVAMGLGWHIARDGATRWHNGQTGGYHTSMLVDRRIHAGVILMCNTATGELDALAESVIRVVAGMNVEPRKFPKQVQVDKEIVSRLAGRYQLAPGLILTVRPDVEKLFVMLTGQGEARVYPDSETKWRYIVVDAQLTFDLPKKGSCTAVTLHQAGRDMRSPRIDKD
jgi:D-alanyl-D-alanine-carboxypeptidase/D-alanyl-D-alanine-endopeptidase